MMPTITDLGERISVPTREGTTRWHAGDIEVETWWRVVGDIGFGPAPLVVLHGGPGATHDYLTPLDAIHEVDSRPVVFYDQLGNGRSTHLPDRGVEFWTVDLFVRELRTLLADLGISGRHHVLGQSWGGCLAQEYALTQPSGLRSLVLADTTSSLPEFVAAANRLRADLPAEVEATLRRHEKAGTTDDAEYVAACDVFYKRHVCRLDPWPDFVTDAFAWIGRDPTVYRTMNGPSEFHVVGSLKDWQVTDRLGDIEAPTLILSGK
jgi:L-proline amide hydrolase